MKFSTLVRSLAAPAVCIGILSTTANAQTTVITSCVSKLTAVSRIVPSAASCNVNSETVVYWNQQGQQGVMGVPGANGSQGAPGQQGVKGDTGSNGVNGSNGAGYNATSTTTQVIYPGKLTFMVQSGLAYSAGSYIRAVADGGRYYLEGTVSSYSDTQLVIIATSGNFPQVILTSSSWAFSIAGTRGVDGTNGAQGPAGPAGPTGPTGATGPGANIKFYFRTTTIPGCKDSFGIPCIAGAYVTQSSSNSCPAGQTAIAASCGYQNPGVSQDQSDVVLNYAGVNAYDSTQALCLVSNQGSGDRGLVIGVTCMDPQPTQSSAVTAPADVVKSCTYDPDTQAPCTAADAVLAEQVSPGRYKAAENQTVSSQANISANASTTSDAAQGMSGKKAKKSVTLWFNQ